MVTKNEKRSFVFYDSFLEAMKHLNDSDFRECVMKIRDYALDGIDEESDSPMVNVIMALVKPNLEAARRRYEISVENGKKGAEYGKLGGAPKGNQNARKKQPLNQPQKQPLDVDVEEDVNVNVNEEVDVNGHTTSGTIVFNPSSIGILEKIIKNDSENLKAREEKKEFLQEVNQYDLGVGIESEKEEENPLYSKSDNSDYASISTNSSLGIKSSASKSPKKKEPGLNYGEYIERYFSNNISKLVDLRRKNLPQDNNLFWQTVGFYCDLYGDSKSEAIQMIPKIINEFLKQGR